MTLRTTHARHRAAGRPKTFLSTLPGGTLARRGTVAAATAGLAITLGAPTASATTTHTVESGDTVSEIASEHGSSVDAIVEANGLDSSATIYVGDELTIPDGSGGATLSGSTGSSAESTSEPVEETGTVESSTGEVVDIARQYIGTPYVYGGSTPGGFDCSGFTQYVYSQVGIELPRTTDDQLYAGTQVSESEAQPGDLVWSPGHVGIYSGDGNYIAAYAPGEPLSERPIYDENSVFVRVG
ncbi:C40 family peptidase [Georgenia alba]|uniref:C40 family peptidase n=1 Tax=Georgenia alba TaxID=2233858 RepID=A0ABW2Q2Y1_9MICO